MRLQGFGRKREIKRKQSQRGKKAEVQELWKRWKTIKRREDRDGW